MAAKPAMVKFRQVAFGRVFRSSMGSPREAL